MKICKNCNIEYETGNFCKKCGSELVEKEEQQELVCSECGMSLSSDFLFCPKCGTKVGDGNKSVSSESWQEVKKFTEELLLQIINVCEFKNSTMRKKEPVMTTILSHDQGLGKRLLNGYNISVDKNALQECKTYGDLVNLIIRNKASAENKSVPAEFGQEEKKQIGVSSNDDEYIKSEIRKFIADFYHRDYDKVKTYVLLRDIGCDNVSKLSWELQRSFGITIPEEYDNKFRTVGDVCFAMDSLLKKN